VRLHPRRGARATSRRTEATVHAGWGIPEGAPSSQARSSGYVAPGFRRWSTVPARMAMIVRPVCAISVLVGRGRADTSAQGRSPSARSLLLPAPAGLRRGGLRLDVARRLLRRRLRAPCVRAVRWRRLLLREVGNEAVAFLLHMFLLGICLNLADCPAVRQPPLLRRAVRRSRQPRIPPSHVGFARSSNRRRWRTAQCTAHATECAGVTPLSVR
jgi:hypothetical protein